MWSSVSLPILETTIIDAFHTKASMLHFRSVLTSLKVDPNALLMSEKSGRVKALIITAKGNGSLQEDALLWDVVILLGG